MVNSHPIRFAHMFSIVKCFVVRKGSEFTTQLSKQDVDLTPEMIQRYSVNGTVCFGMKAISILGAASFIITYYCSLILCFSLIIFDNESTYNM